MVKFRVKKIEILEHVKGQGARIQIGVKLWASSFICTFVACCCGFHVSCHFSVVHVMQIVQIVDSATLRDSCQWQCFLSMLCLISFQAKLDSIFGYFWCFCFCSADLKTLLYSHVVSLKRKNNPLRHFQSRLRNAKEKTKHCGHKKRDEEAISTSNSN